jgi:hypothetical protein
MTCSASKIIIPTSTYYHPTAVRTHILTDVPEKLYEDAPLIAAPTCNHELQSAESGGGHTLSLALTLSLPLALTSVQFT